MTPPTQYRISTMFVMSTFLTCCIDWQRGKNHNLTGGVMTPPYSNKEDFLKIHLDICFGVC